MRVMVVGGGGREHALVYKLAGSAKVDKVFCVPGNAGTGEIAENIKPNTGDNDELIAIAREHDIGLTVVGPEAPLCDGIVDAFTAAGLRIFGPTAAAARIEGDKVYAKRLMKIAHVPAPEGRSFDRFDAAKTYIESREEALVVKAAGLAAGKGVFVCDNQEEALQAAEKIMVDKVFGAAGDRLLVEERLKGQELSILALVDGQTICVLESAQDHKPIGEGDTGPNTGGMGAYSPAPIATPDVMAIVERDVLVPIVDALRQDGAPYRGLLYVGLMLTHGGPKVLEFNCRFGDPETQAVLVRLESDLFELLDAVVDGRLLDADVRWTPRSAVSVVMAAGGYPGAYEKGLVIQGIDDANGLDDVQVFHAGTSKVEHLTVTNGGRVLGVTALGETIAEAKRRAYQGVACISFDDAYFRSDIADKAITPTGAVKA